MLICYRCGSITYDSTTGCDETRLCPWCYNDMVKTLDYLFNKQLDLSDDLIPDLLPKQIEPDQIQES